jgi:hypothetical protein
MAASAAALALILFGGSKWWNAEDRNFNASIYKPLTASAALDASRRRLDLRITDSVWVMRNDTAWLQKHRSSHWSPLIPDHGKLIHVFMIREPDLLAFAHLHPATSDSVIFPMELPSLPAGRYRVYGDIVHESGFTQTLSTRIELPGAVSQTAKPADPDDAAHVDTVRPNSTSAKLEDGSIMTLQSAGEALVVGKEAPLRFSVVGADGKPLSLEPYIGMPGHAVVTRDDGKVFVHLHPSGTISMASQMALMMRQPGDSIQGTLAKRLKSADSVHSGVQTTTAGEISFPYAFPQPGPYHMWVQVKHAGRILTGAFALTVQPSKG